MAAKRKNTKGVKRDLNGPAKKKVVRRTRAAVDLIAHKYIGDEPAPVTYADDNYKSAMVGAFGWYNYAHDAKTALEFVMDYLHAAQRKDDAKAFRRVSPGNFSLTTGWLARMHKQGWELAENHIAALEAGIARAIEKAETAPAPIDESEDAVIEDKPKRKTVQDLMRERTAEAGGEIVGMLDDYIKAGAKTGHNFKPIAALQAANILPAHVTGEINYWEGVKAEFAAAYEAEDEEIREAYGYLSKIQLRNIIKFIDLIIADYNGYIAFKKATAKKTVRKRKVKSPQELVRKLKYLKADAKLKIESIKPTEIVGAKELYVFDVKYRKLMYFVADDFAGQLSVKGTTIEGVDVNKSLKKTLRDPAKQLKEFMKGGKPAARKFFVDVKTTAHKASPRLNENMLILKVG